MFENDDPVRLNIIQLSIGFVNQSSFKSTRDAHLRSTKASDKWTSSANSRRKAVNNV